MSRLQMADFSTLCRNLAEVTVKLLQSSAAQAQALGAWDFMDGGNTDLTGARVLLDVWNLLCSHSSVDLPEFAAAAACLREIAAPLFEE